MCGIAGAVETGNQPRREVVDRQLELLSHRGPDAAGVFAAGAGLVGVARLAVIDLVTGDPPITDEAGSVGAALNGEIYNYRELREQLSRSGHSLRTSGDTEVLAHLAQDLSPVELCRSLEGMFAFAVWDSRRERLLLGRDRLGKKPLYYWHAPGVLVFASEIKAVLAHPRVPRDPDPEAPGAYLTFGYVPTPRTFYAGVRSLPPGHVLEYDAATGRMRLERYWDLPRPSGDMSFDEAARRTRDLLRESVRRRLVADVPVGAFLSGGIDSSTLVALMTELTGGPVRTFTVGFDDPAHDERDHARLVARQLGSEHEEVVVRTPPVDLLEQLLWHHDQPLADAASLPTYVLSSLAREQVTVALAGEGGDELFAGYPRFRYALLSERYRRLPLGLRRAGHRTACALPGRLPGVRRLRRASDPRFAGALETIEATSTVLDAEAQPAGAADWARREFRAAWPASAAGGPLSQVLHLNLRTYLLDDLLPKVDRMSMAHGLEVRSPFLDRELTEFVLALPPDHLARGRASKRVLRAAVADLVPEAILRRPKQGLGPPLGRWFREDLHGPAAALAAPGARVGRHLRPGVIRHLLADHVQGRADHGLRLWALLLLELFLRREGW